MTLITPTLTHRLQAERQAVVTKLRRWCLILAADSTVLISLSTAQLLGAHWLVGLGILWSLFYGITDTCMILRLRQIIKALDATVADVVAIDQELCQLRAEITTRAAAYGDTPVSAASNLPHRLVN